MRRSTTSRRSSISIASTSVLGRCGRTAGSWRARCSRLRAARGGDARPMKIERVLVYRLGSLGDFVVALPALRVVAAAFPGARRMLLTNFPIDPRAPSPREVLEGTQLVDDYVEYPARLRDP